MRDHFRTLLKNGIDAGRYRSIDVDQTADMLWALFLGTLQTVDARTNLGIDGASFADAAKATFALLESSLHANTSRVAEAA